MIYENKSNSSTFSRTFTFQPNRKSNKSILIIHWVLWLDVRLLISLMVRDCIVWSKWKAVGALTHRPWGRIQSAALRRSCRWYRTTSCHHGARQPCSRCSCGRCRGRGTGTGRRWSCRLVLPQWLESRRRHGCYCSSLTWVPTRRILGSVEIH